LGCGARACPEKRWGLENAGAARHCDGGVSAGRLRVFRQAVVDGGGEGAGRGFPVGGQDWRFSGGRGRGLGGVGWGAAEVVPPAREEEGGASEMCGSGEGGWGPPRGRGS
jgi:hypothetical protein